MNLHVNLIVDFVIYDLVLFRLGFCYLNDNKFGDLSCG